LHRRSGAALQTVQPLITLRRAGAALGPVLLLISKLSIPGLRCSLRIALILLCIALILPTFRGSVCRAGAPIPVLLLGAAVGGPAGVALA
jgi:hypothetical protein